MMMEVMNDLENFQNIIFLDLETTGLEPETDKITQIAAIKESRIQGKIYTSFFQSQFVTYVNPECEIPNNVVELTGITNEMVKDAPTEKEALKQLLDFLGDDYIIIAQNASFDLGFLHHAFVRNGFNSPIPCFYCTRAMSAVLFPTLSHRLVDMCNLFDITMEKEHDALNDAEATRLLFYKLIDIAELHKINFINKLIEHPDRPMRFKPQNAYIIKTKS